MALECGYSSFPADGIHASNFPRTVYLWPCMYIFPFPGYFMIFEFFFCDEAYVLRVTFSNPNLTYVLIVHQNWVCQVFSLRHIESDVHYMILCIMEVDDIVDQHPPKCFIGWGIYCPSILDSTKMCLNCDFVSKSFFLFFVPFKSNGGIGFTY